MFTGDEPTVEIVNNLHDELDRLRARSIKSLSITTNTINQNNGWNTPVREDWGSKYRIPTMLSLVHSEVSEALEAFRKNDRDNFIEELADTVIRTLDIAFGLGFDLEAAILAKLEKNKTRGYRHGGKKV